MRLNLCGDYGAVSDCRGVLRAGRACGLHAARVSPRSFSEYP